MYIRISTVGYCFAYFVPSILLRLGWTSIRDQAMSIPLYACAACVSLLFAFASDILPHRFGFIGSIILGEYVCHRRAIIILISQASISATGRHAALFATACRAFGAQLVALVQKNNNLAGHYKCSVGSAKQIAIGNLAGFLAANIFLDEEKPRYKSGYGITFGRRCLGALTASILLIGMYVENTKRWTREERR